MILTIFSQAIFLNCVAMIKVKDVRNATVGMIYNSNGLL